MAKETKFDRRQFMGAAALTIAATVAEPGRAKICAVTAQPGFFPVTLMAATIERRNIIQWAAEQSIVVAR